MSFTNDLPVGAVLPSLASYNTQNIISLSNQGYYFCDGTILFAKDNPQLADAIATCWGGQSTQGKVYQFKLPPLSNAQKPAHLRGVDPTAQRDPQANERIAIAPGGMTGPNPGSFQDYATAAPAQGNHFVTETTGAHTHTCPGIGSYHRHYRGSNAKNELEDADNVVLNNNGAHVHKLGAGNGSGGNLTTSPKTVSVNWIIKKS